DRAARSGARPRVPDAGPRAHPPVARRRAAARLVPVLARAVSAGTAGFELRAHLSLRTRSPAAQLCRGDLPPHAGRRRPPLVGSRGDPRRAARACPLHGRACGGQCSTRPGSAARKIAPPRADRRCTMPETRAASLDSYRRDLSALAPIDADEERALALAW